MNAESRCLIGAATCVSKPRWLLTAGSFLATCLVSCGVMRFLVLHLEAVFTWPVALSSLGLGVSFSWFLLQRWRISHPVRCAAWIGLCAGVAGSGLYTLMECALISLFPPYIGLIPAS
jgi:hypothetical protein